MRIIFFGSSDFVVQVLDSLNKNHKVVAVVSTPNAKVGRKQILTPTPIAQRANELKLTLLSPQTLKDVEIVTTLQNLNPDLFVVASYGKIIPQTILDIPKLGVINIHPSLLPAYRGPTPIQTSLMNGEESTGVSLIKMDAQVDHGPLIAQASLPIQPHDNFAELAKKLFGLGTMLLTKSLSTFATGELIPTEQNHDQATFTKILTKDDGQIKWSNTSRIIYNQFRGLSIWPGLWTTWNDQNIKILDCKPVSESAEGQPGTVTSSGAVICGNSTVLQILHLQLPGKQPTDIQSFLRGHSKFIGSQLN